MNEFREILYANDKYPKWLEKCIIASPLGYYSKSDTVGYFGFFVRFANF